MRLNASYTLRLIRFFNVAWFSRYATVHNRLSLHDESISPKVNQEFCPKRFDQLNVSLNGAFLIRPTSNR
jgi:hypothetical protein